MRITIQEGATLGSEIIAVNVAAVVTLMPMVWYLVRDVRQTMLGVSRQISDLTLAIALDVSTRPTANEPARRLARELADERSGRIASGV